MSPDTRLGCEGRTSWPSLVVFRHHVHTVEEVVFELLQVGRGRKATGGTGNHDTALSTRHGEWRCDSPHRESQDPVYLRATRVKVTVSKGGQSGTDSVVRFLRKVLIDAKADFLDSNDFYSVLLYAGRP